MYEVKDYLDIDKFLKIKQSLQNYFTYFSSEIEVRNFVQNENAKIHTIFKRTYDEKSCNKITAAAEQVIKAKINEDYEIIREKVNNYFGELEHKSFAFFDPKSDDAKEKALVGGAIGLGVGLIASVALAPLALLAGLGALIGVSLSSKKEKLIKAILEYQEEVKKEVQNNIISAIENFILNYYKTLMQNFSYKDLLKNPQAIDRLNVKLYADAADKIEQFEPKNKDLINFVHDTRLIVQNAEIIQEQYKLYKKYLETLCLEDKYYDNNLVESVAQKLIPIANKLDGYKKQFYNFDYLHNLNDYIQNRNNEYIDKHLTDDFFTGKHNYLGGHDLDNDQRKAILQDELSSLIIAGAGCGKTTTIIAKLDYLINVKHVKPEEILLLSFGKDVSKKLKEDSAKIDKNIKACTFHKLGLEILEESSEEKLITDRQYDKLMWQFFHDQINKPKNERVRNNLIKYFSYYINPIDYNKHYKNKNEIYREINRQDLKTLKYYYESKNLQTLNKEIVKSYEELAIANFYFLNGVKYKYEERYESKTSDKKHRQYLPDFYLPDYNLWHEHYGVDEQLRSRQYSKEESKKYRQSIEWKRKTHKANNTTCIETFSYQFKNNTIIDDLTKELKKHKVVFKRLTSKEINDCLYSVCSGYSYASFITLVSTFVSLYKSKYSNEKQFDEFKKEVFPNRFIKERCNIFLDICKDAYLYYKNGIKGKIDFDDMIIQSTKKLSLSKFKDKYKYRYILVDEFQDISFSRKELLNALIKHGSAKLFAVGDDWQSIYRFAGSDLDIFVNFKKHFGNYAQLCYITNTHRNSQKLQDIAGPFIKCNPEQLDKRIVSNDQKLQIDNPIEIIYCHEDKSKQFLTLLEKIYKRDANAKILVLGRNNHDINMILSPEFKKLNNHNKEKIYEIKCTKYNGLKIRFSTVHSAKGLEEQYVILINAENAILGFPNKVEDDYVLNLVLSQKSNYLYAEERRLWYVALTRTKSYVYILTESRNPSEFVREIENKCLVSNKDAEEETHICPECGGLLEKRVGKRGKSFWKCKNYPMCNYVIDEYNIDKVNFEEVCPQCGDYLLKKRRKKDGSEFLRCHNFPDCDYTKNIKSSKKKEESHDIIDDDLPF